MFSQKKLFITLSFLALAVTVCAVPAKPGVWRVLLLADGTEVNAQLKGDEHLRYWQSEDGQAYIQAPGDTCFLPVAVCDLKQKAASRIFSRPFEKNCSRTPLPQQFLTSAGTPNATSGYFGKKKGLLILVNFSDKKFKKSHDQTLYDRIMNEEGYSADKFQGSVSDYFKAQSDGLFELDFDVMGPVEMPNGYAYYGKNDNEGLDVHPAEMVIEAIRQIKTQVSDWHQYDWDNDGEVDQVYLIYAGFGEADTGKTDYIWPHTYALSDAQYYGDGTGAVTVASGLKVNVYACGSELKSGGAIDGIGTICHEFSHCLGYADAYDTSYSGGQGMFNWDIMDSGCYNGDGFLPPGYTSYERWTAGWKQPIVLEDTDMEVTDMKALTSGGNSYIIYNKGNRNEFFMLENRQKEGWDGDLPGFGLLILHIDYDEKVWEENTVNNDPHHQRMTWIPADNEYQYYLYDGEKYVTRAGAATDPYPISTNNAFNKLTKPAALFYNRNSDGTFLMDSSVEDISMNINGDISFRFVARFNDDDTGITEARPDRGPASDDAYYDLQGRRLSAAPLNRGLYIHHGRKVKK